MDKTTCLRCGYREFNGSLHVHHLDYNHYNDTPSNLIVLCSNCHFGLHRNKWKVEEIGLVTPERVVTPRWYKWYNKFKKSDLLDEIEELKRMNITLNDELKQVKQDSAITRETLDRKFNAVVEYINLHDYGLREDIVLLGRTFTAYVACMHDGVDGWSAYKASNAMNEIIIKNAEAIRKHDPKSQIAKTKEMNQNEQRT